ncbi:hypothetical protein C7974DRAFT_454462 [Boeremia exigua]|uniref:uncharacterized protein n=1 Tax=Boeremia exigua TaxID=749465 RepID=UPI001E8DBA5D|nr:uncharacterized protein C7974DRAFT_454462 [Boeremia exigua]KAH6629623.1 hypothetical protein C7974DRAFT_454462 [Boeremia exigua]
MAVWSQPYKMMVNVWCWCLCCIIAVGLAHAWRSKPVWKRQSFRRDVSNKMTKVPFGLIPVKLFVVTSARGSAMLRERLRLCITVQVLQHGQGTYEAYKGTPIIAMSVPQVIVSQVSINVFACCTDAPEVTVENALSRLALKAGLAKYLAGSASD